MQILVLFGAVLVLVLFDIPIAIALGVVAVVALVIMQGVDMLPNVAITMYNGATSFPLIAIPLFIFAGQLMLHGGISARLIAFAASLVGGFPHSDCEGVQSHSEPAGHLWQGHVRGS